MNQLDPIDTPRLKIRQLLRSSSKNLVNSLSPDLDAWVLLKFALQVEDAWLIANEETVIDAQHEVRYRELIDSRNRGVPVAYLTQSRQFWSKNLYVDSRVLIPRPETETLVEAVLNCLGDFKSPSILELGTGSGAISVALSSELPKAEILATDNSSNVLAVAKINLDLHSCSNVMLTKANWFSGLDGQTFDVICTNPPYVASQDPHLDSPELLHEPKSALVAGKDGLDAIRVIVKEAPACLRPKGWLALEHGYDQALAVQKLLKQACLTHIRTVDDLMGHSRVSMARKPE